MERSTGDVPRGIANSEENETLAGSLPMFLSLKSHRNRPPPLPQSREAGGARRQLEEEKDD